MAGRTSRHQFKWGALAALASVLSHTLLIPAVRPFMSWAVPGNDNALHAFMSVSLAGGIAASLLLGRYAHRIQQPRRWIVSAALLDALLFLVCTLKLGVTALLCVRTLQGALNLGGLSLLLGSLRATDATRRGAHFGLLGAAMMAGVALGAPLGTLSLRMDVRAPLLAGAALECLAALVAATLDFEAGRALPRRSRSTWSQPATFWVLAERFAVGCLVVTFALHARRCLNLSDSQVGGNFSWFLLPFAAAVYPLGRLADRTGSRSLAAACLSAYGLGFVCLPRLKGVDLSMLMLLLGVASAGIFAAAMREASAAHHAAGRVAAMSGLNGAGSLGMLAGTALAGMLSAALRRSGASPHDGHEAVFILAGGLPLASAAWLLLDRLLLRHRESSGVTRPQPGLAAASQPLAALRRTP